MNPLRNLWALALFFLVAAASFAQPIPITQISSVKTENIEAASQTLPYFVKKPQWGLSEVLWTITLPPGLSQTALPTLLMPQPVQGAVFSINGQIIYELGASDKKTLRNWYQPVLISIPKLLLKENQETQIKVVQTGHLRGWFIAPMFAGDLQALRPYFSDYVFISQTLYTTINFLSSIVGFFFLVIGLRSKSKAYFYSGMTTLTWSVLITLALTSELPTSGYFYWRMALYAATGLLIYFVSMFTNAVFENEIPSKYRITGLIYLNLGWILYAIQGPTSEQWLDVYWTGLAVFIYIFSAAWVIYQALRKSQYARVLPIAAHWLITSLLAFHDYVLQSGVLPFTVDKNDFPLWANLLLQPIYVTHIALPVFVIMAMWLLIKDHNEKNRSELQHVRQMNAQRERIVNDIHDGVGSRINLMLWSLRTEPPRNNEIESELQRCMEELRFAINPIQAGHETLHKSLSDLCRRLKLQAHQQGIELEYERTGQPKAVASEIGLHLYKATQECLSNALRHSQATRIKVVLWHDKERIGIEVQDDGTGIPDWDNKLQRQNNQKPTSMGLNSLFQRINSKGGQVRIVSNSEGTRIQIQV